jgi:hypothetical protein
LVPSGTTVDSAIFSKDLLAAIATLALHYGIVMDRFRRYPMLRHVVFKQCS